MITGNLPVRNRDHVVVPPVPLASADGPDEATLTGMLAAFQAQNKLKS